MLGSEMTSRHGFTLIEIMIVCAIIPCLTLLAMPQWLKARDAGQKGVCVNNLRMLDAAKEQYALDNGKDSSTTPIPADVLPYLKSGMPECPSSGTYTIGAVGTKPICSVSGHAIS